MFKHTLKYRTWSVTGRLLGAIALCAGSASAEQSGWQAVVSAELLRIYAQPATSAASAAAKPTTSAARFDAAGRVQVDVHFDCAATAPTQQLVEAGLHINASVRQGPLCVIEGWTPPAALPTLASVAHVTRINLPAYRLKRPALPNPTRTQQRQLSKASAQASGTPAIDGNAVTIMQADSFISQTGVNGSGVGVGVMSDDVTSLAVIQSRGELPAVNVVTESAWGPVTNPTDEGTMMLEEVYAVAPGASLAFCGPETSTEYVQCLQNLFAAGASILVDDLGFPNEDLMSSNSTLVLAVESFLSQNPKALLITVTENYNGSYWQGNYMPAPLSSLGLGASATCSNNSNGQTQTDYYINEFSSSTGSPTVEALSVYQAGTYPAILQWADPFGQNVSNFDLYVLDTNGGTITCAGAAGQSNTYFGPFADLSEDTYDMVLATPDQSLAGKFLKLWFGGDGLTALSSSTPGSIISPQAFATGAITIGALDASDGIGDTIEPFSGQGPIQLIVPTPSTLQAPTLVGLDGIYVDFNGTDFSPGLFYGTSAASPNAAAVAALILSAFPTLTPAQLTTALESGATQLGNSNPNSTYGYGRVDALGALNLGVAAPSVSGFGSASIVGGTSSKAAALTVGGVGLTLSVVSSNTALIPATLVAAGSPGITIAPSTCGTSTTACTASVMPIIGQVGSSTVTITVTDGAHRTASVMGVMTVTAPSPPSIGVTGGGSQSITKGGATSPVSFTLTGTGSLTVTVSSSNTTLLPSSGVTLSSGCGTSTDTCTATLTPASGQTGSATVTLTAQDAYQQKGTAMATLQVNAPAKSGGGGAFDPLSLIALLGVYGLRRRAASR